MPDRQYLNAADRLMLVGQEALNNLYDGGFQCQTHVWIGGRIDVPLLRAALADLNRRYPVITSRLVSPGDARGPYWKYQPGAQVELYEATLPTADTASVWAYAEEIYSIPMDHTKDDPITFHLAHLPNGHDVFLMRYGHVLMDGKAPEIVLQEINASYAACKNGNGEHTEDDAADESFDHDPALIEEDEMVAHLSRFDRKRRFKAAMQVVRANIRLPSRSITLVSGQTNEWKFTPYRITVRTLDVEQTETIAERTRQLCGFPSLSPAVLASAFRTISKMTKGPLTNRTLFHADMPLNLRPPGIHTPVFRNFMSFVQMQAMAPELKDRDELTRLLNTRIRDQIRRQIDLGNLQMMSLLSRFTWLLKKHILDRARKQPLTLFFGFLGPSLQGLTEFCDQPIDWLYSATGAVSPPGITLQVNQFAGKLNLVLAYVSETVPEPVANEFLDTLIADMLK